jgi:hypothetical protein
MNDEQRARLNVTTGDLDSLARLAAAQRELGEIANALLHASTSRRAEREQHGRRLNAVKASLHTVELHLIETQGAP